jgi:hypothetical protein
VDNGRSGADPDPNPNPKPGKDKHKDKHNGGGGAWIHYNHGHGGTLKIRGSNDADTLDIASTRRFNEAGCHAQWNASSV